MRTIADPDAFDLVVIGSGPAGEAGAVHAAKFGKRVAVVERAHAVGGAGVNTGTLPSKTLRETATEIVHLAAAVIHFGGTLDYLIEAVFNYPTLTDAFKDAAYDGLNRLSQRTFWQTAEARA